MAPKPVAAELPVMEYLRRTSDAEPQFESTVLFDGSRYPNVVVTRDGTVLATWGDGVVRVRRSLDGGVSWGPQIEVATGRHGGGVTVEEPVGDVLLFLGEQVNDRDQFLYRSTDDGETWAPVEATIHPDIYDNVPALHMAEHGITLHRGPERGRLLRAARVYGDDGYNTAIYSDDRGETWHPSEPFPVPGTGEGAVVELSNGRIYYSSRRHHFPTTERSLSDRLYAWSDDGGETWTDPAYAETIPDGPRYRGEVGRGACHNGHFGMMGGLARLPIRDEDILLYTNADNEGYQRHSLTVWASFDGAETWPVKRRLETSQSAYSSIGVGRPDTPSEGWLYVLYEHGTLPPTDAGADGGHPRIQYTGGTLARFNIQWLVRGELTGDGTLPDWTAPVRER